MSILLTGSNGFIATALKKYLDSIGEDYHCWGRVVSNDPHYTHIDFCNQDQLILELQKHKFSKIYHLAGSFSNQFDIDFKNNVQITQNLLEAIRLSNVTCRTLLIGSAAEYGFVTDLDNPISEKHTLAPCSIYGLIKKFQTELMSYYHNIHHLNIVSARTFNLYGKGISDKLFSGKLYSEIDKVMQGQSDKIILRDLSSKRDYIHVDDAIKIYQMIMDKGESGESYNVGKGRSITCRDLLLKILKEFNLSESIVATQAFSDPHKGAIQDIYADISKIEQLFLKN
jgi:GDP-4-dehydro-6-deoxy-D-mannose reductase